MSKAHSFVHVFTDQRFNAATGLYYYNARYGARPEHSRRNPTLGRFISPDTIVPGVGDPQAWNRYAYVANNPLRFTDPSGRTHLDRLISDWESDWEEPADNGGFGTASRLQPRISKAYRRSAS